MIQLIHPATRSHPAFNLRNLSWFLCQAALASPRRAGLRQVRTVKSKHAPSSRNVCESANRSLERLPHMTACGSRTTRPEFRLAIHLRQNQRTATDAWVSPGGVQPHTSRHGISPRAGELNYSALIGHYAAPNINLSAGCAATLQTTRFASLKTATNAPGEPPSKLGGRQCHTRAPLSSIRFGRLKKNSAPSGETCMIPCRSFHRPCRGMTTVDHSDPTGALPVDSA